MAENLILIFFVMLMAAFFGVTRFYFRAVLPSIRERKVLSLICGNALVFLFLLSVVLLCGEVYFRFVFDSTDSFGLCRTTERWFQRHYHRNTTGFRDSTNYLPEPPFGASRISFVGDSFTAGHGIADVENRFANLVRKKQSDWEIHVLAECGWDTGMELDLLEFIPRSGYETDYVVLVYCLNDVADIVPEWLELSRKLYEAPKPGFFFRFSYFLNTIYGRLKAARDPRLADYYEFVRDGYKDDLWEQQKLRLRKIKAQVESHNWKLLVVTFPFVHNLGNEYAWAEEHARLREFWSSESVPHLDLLPALKKTAALPLVVGKRDAHPNERAHAIAADEMLNFLKTNIQ